VPLPVSSSNPLAVPADQFNADGLAVVFLSGGRYDGDWIVAASTAADGPQLGGFTTEAGAALTELKNDPAYPDRAIETAFIWLHSQSARLGWRVVGFECLNDQYEPGERPYFALARAVIASGAFTPAPGVIYADAMTLDEVMAGMATPLFKAGDLS
jgi:hypothetical protein